MKTKLAQLTAACFVALCLTACCNTDKEWESLFNGKDLSGWTVVCQPQDQEKVFWTVDEGSIYCNSIGRKDHNYMWLISDRKFDDFELQLKFQAYRESPGNSGLQFRSRYDFNAENGGWLNGPQIDIHPPQPMNWRTGLVYDETNGENRWVYPSLPDPGMREEYEPKEHIFKYADDGDGWNDMTLICQGMKIKVIVNGIVRTDWDATGVLDNELHQQHNVGRSGQLAFQLHSNDELKIRYKDIRIKQLPAEK